jgi:integrase
LDEPRPVEFRGVSEPSPLVELPWYVVAAVPEQRIRITGAVRGAPGRGVWLAGRGGHASCWPGRRDLTAVELRRRRAAPRQGAALFAIRTGAAIVPSGVFRLLRGLALAAGLPTEIQRGISPHCARHTAAALALSAGEDIDTIRDFLGHPSIQVTQRYLHGDGTHTPHRVAAALAGHLPTP